MKDLANTYLLKCNENLKNQMSKLDIFETLSLDVCLDAFSTPDFKVVEKERVQPFETFLEPIQKFKNKPCVYFIEIVEGNTEKIRTTYEKVNLTNKAGLRKVDKKYFETKCLYVGRSQKTIIHRLIVHFGYKNTSENGLQLLHWGKSLNLKLRIHIYCFSEELGFLLPLYERQLNKELKPLIGYL
jgi:hypothetical protein